MKKAVIFDMYETLITHFEPPLYFGSEMAKDMGIDENVFLPAWRSTENDRTLGNLSTDDVVERLLRDNNCYSSEVLKLVMDKRIATKVDCFNHLHNEIIPMLSTLKDKGIKIGLISNCFSEEAKVIRDSVLFPYFDAAMMSYEQNLRKPGEEIYYRCMETLGVSADECLYVGDGGSDELATASKVGMTPLQATWYLKEGTKQPVGRMKEYIGLTSPLEIIGYL